MYLDKTLLMEFFTEQLSTNFDALTQDLCDTFISQAQREPEIVAIFDCLTEAELSHLRQTQCKFMIELLHPLTEDEQLDVGFCEIGRVHSLVGMQTAWLSRIFLSIEERLAELVAHDSDLTVASQRYLSFVRGRLASFINRLFEAEAGYEAALETCVAKVTIAVESATTAADAIKAV